MREIEEFSKRFLLLLFLRTCVLIWHGDLWRLWVHRLELFNVQFSTSFYARPCGTMPATQWQEALYVDAVKRFVALVHRQIRNTVFQVWHEVLPMHPLLRRITECMSSFCFLGFPHSGLRSLPGSTSHMYLARMQQTWQPFPRLKQNNQARHGHWLLWCRILFVWCSLNSPGYDGAGKVCWFDVAFVHSRHVSEHWTKQSPGVDSSTFVSF